MADPAKKSKRTMTRSEFYAWAQNQPAPHELIRGVPQPRGRAPDEVMIGGTSHHSYIISNLVRHLGNKLEAADKPCRAEGPDYGVDVSEAARSDEEDEDTIVYPDVVVDCGYRNRPEDQDRHAVTPTVVVEVLSKSTRSFDLGEKREWYEATPKIENILYVEQKKAWVKLHTRLPDGKWLTYLPCVDMDEAIEIPALGISIAMREIYKDVTFKRESSDTEIEG